MVSDAGRHGHFTAVFDSNERQRKRYRDRGGGERKLSCAVSLGEIDPAGVRANDGTAAEGETSRGRGCASQSVRRRRFSGLHSRDCQRRVGQAKQHAPTGKRDALQADYKRVEERLLPDGGWKACVSSRVSAAGKRRARCAPHLSAAGGDRKS